MNFIRVSIEGIKDLKELIFENWQIVIIGVIMSTLLMSILNYEPKECEEFDLVDKIEKSEVHNEYLIYYSDGKIKSSYSIPKCIKLRREK